MIISGFKTANPGKPLEEILEGLIQNLRDILAYKECPQDAKLEFILELPFHVDKDRYELIKQHETIKSIVQSHGFKFKQAEMTQDARIIIRFE